MADVGKTIGGILMVGAGIALQFVPGGQFVGLVLMSAGTSLLSVGLFGLPEMAQGAKVSVTSTQASIPIVYGECKLSHAVADTTVAGVDNQKLYIMGAICLAGEGGQGIESIEEIYLFPDETSVGTGIEFDTNATTPKNGGVASRYTSKSTNWYKYQLHSGKDTQVFDAWLDAVGVWDETFYPVGLGLAWAAHWLLWDKDEEKPIWARGTPRDIQYLVHGCLLYDPRYPTDGPDSDGWIWDRIDNPSLVNNPPTDVDNHPGSNPGLQLLDYLTSKRYGMGIPYAARGASWGPGDEIDEASFEALADHCDETVTTVGLTPNVTHPRYTCDIMLRTGDSHKTNLEKLLSACNAMLVYEGGKFKVIPRKVTTAQTYEITEEKIVGSITVLREGSTVPNTIKVRYADKDNDYTVQEVVWPEPGTNDFLIADNNFSVERIIDLPGTINWYQAQQLAMVTLREMREDVTIEVTVREDALQLSVGDVVKLTYDSAGWTQKEFWVVGMSLQSDDLIKLQLNEYDSDVYSIDPQDDRPTTPGTNLPDPFSVAAATAVTANCAAGYYLNDGVFVPRVEVSWTHSTDAFAVSEELVYKKDADTDWIYTGKKVPIADTATLTWESNLEFGTAYDFGIVVWNTLNIKSAVAETASACTISEPTDPSTTPTFLSGKRLPDGQWGFRWLADDEAGTLAYVMRYQNASGASDWDTGTQVWYGFGKYALIDWRDFPIGRIRVMVKALSKFAIFSTGYAELIILNQPVIGNPLDSLREQIRKRKMGDADGAAFDVLTGDGEAVLIGSEAGTVGEDLLYLNSGISLLDLEPIEGASQVNRIIERPALAHLGEWIAPNGYTIYSVKYLSGGLSVEGASVWDDEKSVIDESTGATAPPTTYAQTPAVEVDGDTIKALLYLTESDSGGTPTPRSVAFAAPTVLTTVENTGDATPAAADLPAYDDTYRAGYSFSLVSDKGGSYSVTVVLKMWKDGVPSIKDTNIHTGTLPEIEAAGTLYGVMAGWDGAGGDVAQVQVTNISAAGNWTFNMPVELLRWTENQDGTPLYASMTPNDELAVFEVELIQT